MLNNNNDLTIKQKGEELKALLDIIHDLYEPTEDEFLNEMFYSGMYKAKEFCNTIEYIIRKKSIK